MSALVLLVVGFGFYFANAVLADLNKRKRLKENPNWKPEDEPEYHHWSNWD